MTITVKLFGPLKEQIADEVICNLSEKVAVKDVLSAMQEKYPLFAQEIGTCNVAVDQCFIDNESVQITTESEVALIPPVSGG